MKQRAENTAEKNDQFKKLKTINECDFTPTNSLATYGV